MYCKFVSKNHRILHVFDAVSVRQVPASHSPISLVRGSLNSLTIDDEAEVDEMDSKEIENFLLVSVFTKDAMDQKKDPVEVQMYAGDNLYICDESGKTIDKIVA